MVRTPKFVIVGDSVPFHRVPVDGFFPTDNVMFRRGSVFRKVDKSHAVAVPNGQGAMIWRAMEKVQPVAEKWK
jgi:hypothetical protein